MKLEFAANNVMCTLDFPITQCRFGDFLSAGVVYCRQMGPGNIFCVPSRPPHLLASSRSQVGLSPTEKNPTIYVSDGSVWKLSGHLNNRKRKDHSLGTFKTFKQTKITTFPLLNYILLPILPPLKTPH